MASSTQLVSKSVLARMFRDYNARNVLVEKGYLKDLGGPSNRNYYEILKPLPTLQEYDVMVGRAPTVLGEDGKPKRRRRTKPAVVPAPETATQTPAVVAVAESAPQTTSV